jgi:sigma-B regulation protein RsbU (phosphoserine phosphatase)
MGKTKGLVILVGTDEGRLQILRANFQAEGRELVVASDIGKIDDLCNHPLSQAVILFSKNISISNASQLEEFSKLCQKYLIIVALETCSAQLVADFFRLGAADVILSEATDDALAASMFRVDQLAEMRQRTIADGDELEKANRGLQESLRLLKQDQMAGREVQKSLMPESPLKFGDYKISHSITPSLYLSGDFVGYNFILGRYLLFYFADVSGHGASSAFVTVLLRFMIGRVIRRHELEKDYVALAQAPDGLVEHVNNQLLASGLGKHLTIVAGSLDTETRKLRYVVGAQQPSPILVSSGRAEFLPGKGKPAGIFEDATWVVEETTLPESFALVLLSDGIFDLLPDKEIIDKEQTLLDHVNSSSGDIEQLKAALFIDDIEDPQDDISVLLLTGGM